MAKIAANNIRVYLNAVDLSGMLSSTSQKIDQETPVVTAFSDAGPRRLAGNYDISHSHLGYFDAPVIDGFLKTLLPDTIGDSVLTTTYGTAEGSVAYTSLVNLTSKPLTAQNGGAALLNFDAAGSGGVSRGIILRSGTLTGAGNGTGQQQGATTSGQIYRAVFQVMSFSGTSITLKVQESSDNGSGDAYADIASLTSGALTTGIVFVTTTAATEAWKRVVASGTFSSAVVLVTAGVVSP